jgi:hypothetical protein
VECIAKLANSITAMKETELKKQQMAFKEMERVLG